MSISRDEDSIEHATRKLNGRGMRDGHSDTRRGHPLCLFLGISCVGCPLDGSWLCAVIGMELSAICAIERQWT